MRLLSWLHGRAKALRAARALRKRYGNRAGELASTFVANAAEDGDEEARRHWNAVHTELRRTTAARDLLEDSPSPKEPKRRVIEWD